MKRPVAILALLAAAAACASAAPASASGDPSAGATIVQANGCAGCHGANLKGGTGPALYGIEHQLSAARIAAAIANPKAPMPKFPLSAAQIADVVAYLSSLDGGSAGQQPVATLSPAKPKSQAVLTVRFPGTPPSHVTALPSMEMGASAMHDAKVTLQPTSDPHVFAGKVSFSMGGPWTIDVQYDGKHLTLPVNVAGASM